MILQVSLQPDRYTGQIRLETLGSPALLPWCCQRVQICRVMECPHTDIGIVALQCIQHFALNPNVGEMLPQLVPWDGVKCFAKVDEARI